MTENIRIGTIKRCNYCGSENYIRANKTNCPSCDMDVTTYPEKKSPDIIVFLGTSELNRRTVVELSKQGLIDDFSR